MEAATFLPAEGASQMLSPGLADDSHARAADAAFAAYAGACRARVDQAVSAWLDRPGRADSAEVTRVGAALRSLATRGGKRLRAVLLTLSYESALTGAVPADAARQVEGAAVALELLQVYLLVHDDWMDGDSERRGGPTVHRALGEAFGSAALGASTAVLAGDLASALAQDALFSLPLPAANVLAAAQRFARMQRDVVAGQIDDVCAPLRDLEALTGEAVERLYALKTGSYTVAGPLALGAILAGASPAHVAALDAFGSPLGIAFQLRDDLLGVFGDPARTGKPRFGDFRQGKRTALVAEIAREPAARAQLREVLGRADASEADCERLAQVMVETGARARVEARVELLAAIARSRLADLGLAREHGGLFEGAARALLARAS